MALLTRTFAVANKMLDDIKKFVHVITILVSVIFLGYYSFSVVINYKDLFYLIIYSLFLCVGITTFVTYLSTYKKKNKSKTFTRSLRIAKYVLNATMLVVNGCQLFSSADMPSSSLIFFIISGAALVLQVLIEIISFCIQRYISMFKTAVEMDLDFVNRLNPKDSFYEMINNPLEKWANKIQNRQSSKTEEELLIEELAEQYGLERKEKKKEKRKTRRAEQKAKMKENYGIIKDRLKEKFSRKKRKQEKEEN